MAPHRPPSPHAGGDPAQGLADAHVLSAAEVATRVGVGETGLPAAEVARRQEVVGPNRLPEPASPSGLLLFVRQFGNPLIYVLLAAAAVTAWQRDWADAGFIAVVLLINAGIGAVQESQAFKSARALSRLVTWQATVIRDGEVQEVPAETLVPGDRVVLAAGAKVSADLRLTSASHLELDESALTGESLPVRKDPEALASPNAGLADQPAMAFAGTLVTRGHGQGLVVATGTRTALGQLSQVSQAVSVLPPLLQRMERFTRTLAIGIAGASLVIAAVGRLQGASWQQVMMLAVGLAVAAIPEGLPAALTIVLAVATRRMAARNVIVRQLVSVEALGSCTIVASDKTGTLTVNQLTVTTVALPGEPGWTVSGPPDRPEGEVTGPTGPPEGDSRQRLQRLAQAAVLANEGRLVVRPDGTWHGHGDAADVALLVFAHRAGVSQVGAHEGHQHLAEIPFDPDHRFAAVCDRVQDKAVAYVKGAPERVLAMCDQQSGADGDGPVDRPALLARATALAADGYRVLALAAGPIADVTPAAFGAASLRGLTCLGLVGMVDPVRPEARQAVADSRAAGVDVAMVTGDHPVTALAIARSLDLAHGEAAMASGQHLREADGKGALALAEVVRGRRVFARIEPQQKLAIVQALQRNGHVVAVTGDGANDVPALRAAHVSVAMGKGGTDIAREAADLILTDDNFASIVAGIREGRIAYDNIRKVVFLLLAIGAAELALFVVALLVGAPLPLLPVQLLWLNLVTNGIQHLALALEPGEGDELQRPPRPPAEPIFDGLMIGRVGLSGLYVGAVTMAVFLGSLATGTGLADARNGALFLIVLFENVLVLTSRSERRSIFRLSWRTNPWLPLAVAAALALHVGATLWPPTQRLLGLAPLQPTEVAVYPLLALSLVVVTEGGMAIWRRHRATVESRTVPAGQVD